MHFTLNANLNSQSTQTLPGYLANTEVMKRKSENTFVKNIFNVIEFFCFMSDYAKIIFQNSETHCTVLASLEVLEYVFIIPNKQHCMDISQNL